MIVLAVNKNISKDILEEKNLKKFLAVFSLIALLAAGVVAPAVQVSAQEEIEKLTVAFVPSRDPEDIITTTEPLKQMLIDELATLGFNVGEIEITVGTSYEAVGEAMSAGTAEIGLIPGGTFVLFSDDVEVLLTSTRAGLAKDSENPMDWNDGQATETSEDQVTYYKSLVIAGPSEKGQELAAKINAGEELTWDDLNSANWAVMSSSSSAGYIYPTIWLGGQFDKGVSDLAQAVQSEEKVEVAASQTQAGAAPVVERAQAVTDQAPAVRKALTESGIAASDVAGSGRGGRITKEDVANHQTKPAAAPLSVAVGERIEKRVPMTRLRKRVAERLLAATQETAMLTTFNEVNMKPIMEMRAQYKDAFEKRHGARLGFMSFFVKAATEALKRYPAVNASIDGEDIVYHGFYDIGVAVSSERGLVVPVLRDTDRMNYAEVENGIRAYAAKARDGKLGIEDMTGGTFTITNGGTFGSLLSTPILNTPQTAILGMHKIQDRPMAVNGQVEILPMMYLALSYDHRLIDGKEAVGFLVAIKELLEEPARLILDL